MFKTKQAKTQNAAAIPMGIPRPQPQIVNNHAPSEAGLFAVKALALFIGAIAGWYFLVYVVEQAGYRHPEQQLARWVLLILSIVVLGLLVRFALQGMGKWFLELQRENYAHKQTMKELDQRLLETQITRNALPAPSESRLTEEDSKLRVNLIAVMTRAYSHYNSEGEFAHKKPRPWSQDQVYQNPPSENSRIRYNKTGKVREWLVAHNVIVGEAGQDQINIEQYPTVLDFVQEVERCFTMPVVVNSGKALSPASIIGQYQVIR